MRVVSFIKEAAKGDVKENIPGFKVSGQERALSGSGSLESSSVQSAER